MADTMHYLRRPLRHATQRSSNAHNLHPYMLLQKDWNSLCLTPESTCLEKEIKLLTCLIILQRRS